MSRPVNVLVYSGTGSTAESIRHCLFTLRKLLSPFYAVIPVSGEQVLKEPWMSTCAAIVFPGGADLGYCRTLNGEGNRRIRRFVENGGLYIGFCAGGYYGSKRCEFEVGNDQLEVVGDRELAFYPGIARGGAFSGFVYRSERGARAAELRVGDALSTLSLEPVFRTYYNGGSVFVDAEKYHDQGVEILASYTEKLAVDSGAGAAAVVCCKRGKGRALLTGPHPEFVFQSDSADHWSLTKPRFAAANLNQKENVPGFDKVVELLAQNEKARNEFMKACLVKVGLKVAEEKKAPSLSCIHLSSLQSSATAGMVETWKDIIHEEDGERYIDDDCDKFRVISPSDWDMEQIEQNLEKSSIKKSKTDSPAHSTADQIVDYSSLTKDILTHTSTHPSASQTPFFNHQTYYSSLTTYQSQSQSPSFSKYSFGTSLLYSEILSSTNTLLERNLKILRHLPTGFTATATSQLAGRGRGTNTWISPPGSLMFSTVIRHPMAAMQAAPVVFVQYLAALAVVKGIRSYDGDGTGRGAYAHMPVKLKWPNDIYALDPTKINTADSSTPAHKRAFEAAASQRKNYIKIGGILINSHYNTESYIAVCGVGLNVDNTAPTTSLNTLLSFLLSSTGAPRERFTPERLLARILTTFESLYSRFMARGFEASGLKNEYYDHWLHSGQVVRLEVEEGGGMMRIRGISDDAGLLVAEEVVRDEYGLGRYAEEGDDGKWRATGKVWKLQSDSNSFDFFRGLVRRKM